MTEILPIIIAAACTALLGGVIGFHIGYATRNPKRKEEHSPLHTTRYPVDAPPVPAPTKDESMPACTQYAIVVELVERRNDIYSWDAVEKVYVDIDNHNLIIRLNNGREHKYSDAICANLRPVADLRTIIYWKERV